MTRSEELVLKLCHRSFLSLWSYANPRGKHGKELCDVLVVCDPDVIIFSVKEVRSKESGDVETDWSRWTREAINASVKQIYGAERWLRSATHVFTKAGIPGLLLPDLALRRVHRIAVALGSGGLIPIAQEDHGKGFVHVLEEGSLEILIRELDTITDFTEYLGAKEVLLATTMVMVPGEENLMAAYLRAGRRFEHTPDMLALEGDDWENLIQSEPYKAKQSADEASRPFDWIIATGTGSTPYISAISGKVVSASDTDRNDIPELPACFARSDFTRLFDGITGRQAVAAVLDGRLVDGKKFSAPLTLTIVGHPDHDALAASVSPNPLNPRGTLSFTVSRAAPVSIRLFDVHGRLRRTIADNGWLDAGPHSVPIDGVEDSGSPLGSGVYFYKIETSRQTTAGRFVIVR